MSRDLVSASLIERFGARALQHGPAVAQRCDFHALASAVNDEVRHGKPGTVRSANGVFVYRASKCLTEAVQALRCQEQQSLLQRERYAELYVSLFREVALQRPSPGTLAQALRTFRANGFPLLNPRIAEKLLALGEFWAPEPLTPPRERGRPKRTRTGQAREDRHARARSLSR